WSDRAGWVLATSGVVAIGAGVVFVIQARNNADANATAQTLDDWTTSHDAWQTDRIVAGVAAGVGAALIVGASIRFMTASHGSVVAKPAATGHGAVLVLEGAW